MVKITFRYKEFYHFLITFYVVKNCIFPYFSYAIAYLYPYFYNPCDADLQSKPKKKKMPKRKPR